LGVGDFAGDDQNPPHQIGAKLPNGRDHFPSGYPRATEIEEDRVEAFLFDHGQRLAAIAGNAAFASESSQQNVEDIADGGFTFDDENVARPKAGVQGTLRGAG
jgi:hypothetical protein